MQLSPKGKPASRWMALQIVMTVQQVGRANGSPIGHPTQIGASAARGSGQDSATAALTVKCRWIDGHLRGRRRGAAARRRRTTSAGGQRDGKETEICKSVKFYHLEKLLGAAGHARARTYS